MKRVYGYNNSNRVETHRMPEKQIQRQTIIVKNSGSLWSIKFLSLILKRVRDRFVFLETRLEHKTVAFDEHCVQRDADSYSIGNESTEYVHTVSTFDPTRIVSNKLNYQFNPIRSNRAGPLFEALNDTTAVLYYYNRSRRTREQDAMSSRVMCTHKYFIVHAILN